MEASKESLAHVFFWVEIFTKRGNNASLVVEDVHLALQFRDSGFVTINGQCTGQRESFGNLAKEGAIKGKADDPLVSPIADKQSSWRGPGVDHHAVGAIKRHSTRLLDGFKIFQIG
jgi:hypothetical protein